MVTFSSHILAIYSLCSQHYVGNGGPLCIRTVLLNLPGGSLQWGAQQGLLSLKADPCEMTRKKFATLTVVAFSYYVQSAAEL